MNKVATLLFIMIFVAACGVTETGNPCSTGECETASAPDSSGVYANKAFGVNIAYPSGWTYSEAADGASVTFTSDDVSPQEVITSFERLIPVPNSLIEYLEENYPDCTFSEYETDTLLGYSCTGTEADAEGNVTQEYFFMESGILTKVSRQVGTGGTDAMPVSSGKTEFQTLLDGVSYE